MTLHLHHPGRDPADGPAPPLRLLFPECAGASRHRYKECPRCGATYRDRCGDDEAYAVQMDRRRALAEEASDGR
jgi:hypothetical protein